MAINLNLVNIRCTVFTDKLVPFSVEMAEIIKNNLNKPKVTPVILTDIQNVIMSVPGQVNQNWGLIENNKKIFEIRGNKIDFFYLNENEDSVCKLVESLIPQLLSNLGLKAKRLAFAPTYEYTGINLADFYEKTLKTCNFEGAQMQDFSMNRVYYKTEDIEGFSYNIIYNSAIAIQSGFMITSSKEEKKIIIMNDINTRDFGSQFYSEEQIKIFFKNIANKNQNLLDLILG